MTVGKGVHRQVGAGAPVGALATPTTAGN